MRAGKPRVGATAGKIGRLFAGGGKIRQVRQEVKGISGRRFEERRKKARGPHARKA
jgi:hypothetical protein